MKKSDIYIIIPAHNETKRIGDVLRNVVKTKHPVVAVDDGSKDNTFNVVKRYKVIALKHKVNLGKGAAMITGAEAAFSLGAKAIVFMDADGQHDVNDLDNFIRKLNESYSVIYGTRKWGAGTPKERLLGNKITSLLVKYLYGVRVTDILCGYRAITKRAYTKIKWDSTSYGVEAEMLIRASKANLKYCEVPVAAVYLESYKGMTFSHAFQVTYDILRWRITI